MIDFETAVLNAKSWEERFFLRPYIIDSIWFRHFKPSLPQCVSDIDKADSIVIWSDQMLKTVATRKELFNTDGSLKKPLVVFEDVFIRNVDLYQNKNSQEYNKKYAYPIGFTISNFAHYDIRGHGRLESMLTDKFINLTTEQINRAQRNINFIITNRISKYNNQQKHYTLKNQSGLKILIIDQAYEDKSVMYSNANGSTFKQMLDDALELTSNVSIKIHPEQLVGNRAGYFAIKQDKPDQVIIDSQQYPTVNLISDYINPISLLENFDEVWTVSSQMGFEALMLGKKVRCYGTPFYAGYGLTEDMDSNAVLAFRNAYPKTLEEIFYNAYIRYASYFNYNNTSIKWEIEDALEHIKNGIQEVFHR